MESTSLRVSIYSIPDLAGDELKGLKKYIVDEFKTYLGHDVNIQVESSADPYDLDTMSSTYLGTGKEAYDIMEVDTILLGELAETGKLQFLDGHFSVTAKEYSKSAVQAVNYKGELYGVPTLQCATLLMELSDGPQTPVLQDWASYADMTKTLDEAYTSKKLHLAGNFNGSWVLPMFYMDSYIDKYGPDSVDTCFKADIDDEVTEDMKHFTGYGVLPDKTNPSTNGTYKNNSTLVDAIASSEHILMYTYSELLGMVRQKKDKQVLGIASPPLAKSNYLLTYTDAVVVNKSKFTPQRQELIKKFVTFYTSLKFRTAYAMGEDLKIGVKRPRYVLPARPEFFAQTEDANYKMFSGALQHSAAAPNHGVYATIVKKDLKKELEKKLSMA